MQFHQSLRNPSLILKEALIVSGPISFISPIAVHLLRSVSCLVIILRSNIVLLIYLWYTRYCMLQIDISFLTYHREVFSVNTILGRCHAAVVTSMVYFDTGLVCGVHKHCKWIHLYYRCIYGVGSRGGAQDLVAWNYRFCRIEWCYSRWTFQYEP